MLMREMEEEMWRQESVIVNNVDDYDDMKIICRSIPKESWRKIPVVKEVTRKIGSGRSDDYDDMKIICRSIPKESWRKIPVVKEVTSWETSSEPIKCSRAGKNRTITAGEKEQMRREEECFDHLCVMNKPARRKIETSWLSAHVLKVRKILALKYKGRKVQQCQKTFQRLQICVQRTYQVDITSSEKTLWNQLGKEHLSVCEILSLRDEHTL
ncbi:calcium-dependent protein kinase 33 [Dorcoceras hygrometricum]|uniref:Calcium-dependent protein kinase 33 n=1 Tax=Dorcoceras hygrometricum TaxID=472368 RepID=A0A2Z7BK67_9LAMI|nr:calcium-dependent protein kinase 33 [Dorcoceras hygrometricum]